MDTTTLLITVSSAVFVAAILGSWKVIMRQVRGIKIYAWLKENTEDKAGKQFKTTNEISQALGIPQQQVREACTTSRRIYKQREKEDSWGIFGDTAKTGAITPPAKPARAQPTAIVPR